MYVFFLQQKKTDTDKFDPIRAIVEFNQSSGMMSTTLSDLNSNQFGLVACQYY